MASRVALVTGANKGIGLAIVRGLCKKFEGTVYLTARDVPRGQDAVAKLQEEGLEPKFHQLDVTDTTSINNMAQYIKDTYGGLDVLIQNAGIAYGPKSRVPLPEQAYNLINTNFWGLVNVSRSLSPLLNPGSRMVNLSTLMATPYWKKMTEEMRKNLQSCGTVDEVGEMMNKYIQDARSGTLTAWRPINAYMLSKVGVSLITPIQQQELDPDASKDIAVNCCCPGYVATDMTDHKGNKTVDQGAISPQYLAMLPQNTDVRGKMISSRKEKNWME